MLLPHEIIKVICQECVSMENFLKQGGLDPVSGKHLEEAKGALGIVGNLVGIGFWLDGVCCKWDRSSSYDMLVMSFPGLEGRWANLRIPLCH